MMPQPRLWPLWKVALAVLLAISLAAVVAVWWLNVRDESPLLTEAADSAQPSAADVTRGAYLAKAGNCMACHTAKGGLPGAGGRAIQTPFGAVYSSNLTPDAATGLGRWTSAQFWRALHNGRSADGRLLYPAFPYTDYTHVSRDDANALFAYFKSLPAVAQANTPHALDWPFNTQAALAVWRAWYFKPGSFQPEPQRSTEWNRGAYLVRGLGHCAACHTARTALGGTGPLDLAGGLIPMQNWYAPSLTSVHEAGVADWPVADVVSLLKTGVSPRASVQGPMTEVVLYSTQYLSEPDLRAMAVFLKDLPPSNAPAPTKPRQKPTASTLATGERLYEKHCVQCHGEGGEGRPGAYPALAGNRAVTLHSPVNLVQVVLQGGYPPATQGNPRPFGMPPYRLQLSDADVAAVLSFIRSSWGNQAAEVSTLDVSQARSGTR